MAYRPIVLPDPHITVFADASFLGWGCFVPGSNMRTGGRWKSRDLEHDINYLELKVVLFSLQACCRTITNSHILVRSDNTTTVVSINKQGSTQSLNCNEISREIWGWAIDRNNWLSAAHCPGVENSEADQASRVFDDTTEWMLHKDCFNRICTRFGYPQIDLFASRLNYQVLPYCSWQADPGALMIDAFTLTWHHYSLIYCFPPFSIVGKVLQKIRVEHATAVIIVPDWPTQPWFSVLHKMLVKPPV